MENRTHTRTQTDQTALIKTKSNKNRENGIQMIVNFPYITV